jgi:GntR family transcriptional regulator of abcA and norABC
MLELLQRDLRDIAEWKIPEGGFYIWLRFTAESLSIRKLFYACLEADVLIHPGYLYDRMDASHIRLSYAYASQDETERGLMVLVEAARRLMVSSL